MMEIWKIELFTAIWAFSKMVICGDIGFRIEIFLMTWVFRCGVFRAIEVLEDGYFGVSSIRGNRNASNMKRFWTHRLASSH